MPRVDELGVVIYDNDSNGYITDGAYPGTTPTTAGKFAVGCRMVDTTNGKEYYNAGTVAAPSWNSVSETTPAESDGVGAEAVTATADGLTTGIISATAKHITITSANADHIVTLPASVVGKIITGYVGANGCELRTTASSNIKINDVDSDGTNEAAIPADTNFRLLCVSSTLWILTATTKLGAVVTAIIPDAA